MNTVIVNQSEANAVQLFPVLEVKVCSSCSLEMLPQETTRRTSFGLSLCDDCLYS